MTHERVLCFERSILDSMGTFEGISFDNSYLNVLLNTAVLFYKDRATVEEDYSLKQVIPHILVICGSKVLRYRRGRSGGENRLHDFYALGLGGHINDQDVGADWGYLAGLHRELTEEIALPSQALNVTPGLAAINVDSVPVGRVHFGIVHVWKATSEDVISCCSDVVEPTFVEMDAIVREPVEHYEWWARACLSNLFGIVTRALSTSEAV